MKFSELQILSFLMGDQPTEETQFVVDEVSNVIKEAIETTIGGNSYMVSHILNLDHWNFDHTLYTNYLPLKLISIY